MISILQTLKELPEKLYEIELIGKDLGEFLEECQSTFDEFILAYTSQRIEELDNAILLSREERENFKVIKKDVPRSLETKHGLLKYSRRYYQDSETRDYCYLTYLALGIEPYQRLEDNLQLSLVKAASSMSYRQASKLVCSASTVMKAIRSVSVPELADENEQDKKRVDEIHIQADEDHFHLEKALLEVCQCDSRLRAMLRECLSPWDNEKLEKELQILVNSHVCTGEKAEELWVYLQNNKEGIVNHFSLNQGGSCAEGLVSHVFSRRFSGDPMSWSYKSLDKLSAIRVHLENGNKLDRTMLRKKI